MKTLILAKHTGLGNQVQFLPVIHALLKAGHEINSDSDVYHRLGFPVPVNTTSTTYDRVYVVFGCPWWRVWLNRVRYCNSKIYGYRYRIRGRSFGLGYTQAYNFDHARNELQQNVEHFGGCPEYPLKPKKSNRLVIHYSTRPERGVSMGRLLVAAAPIMEQADEVIVIGDDPDHPNYRPTPTLEALRDVLMFARWFIGPDTGAAHVAGAMGCECTVFFGPTCGVKSGPVNGRAVQSSLDCSPCYRWGRAECIKKNKYECLKHF